MSATAPAREGGRSRPWLQARVSLALDLLAVSIVVFVQAVLIPSQDRPKPEKSFFAYPYEASLMLLTVALFVGTGVWAAVRIVRQPLVTTWGRWATYFAAFNIGLTPAIAIVAYSLSVFGVYFPEDWGQPFMPFWAGSGVAAILCGLLAEGERDRGLLMIPLILGALVLTFTLGEILAPH